MASTEDTTAGTERIDDVDVIVEMQNSYVDYALSVVHSRALPDARDGLKPVQRRILYQMSEMGLVPTKGHVKSSRVVGEVMGKLHPHGDTAIYDAMVRMASINLLRVPLIDGHGNFGSLDDGPAAPRYTEARLAPPALLMVEDLDEDVVEMVPNYDAQFMQPSVLPAAYPNLIVNGSSGIAVGMATNLAPHNPGEAIEAARYLLDNPAASLEEIMQYLPGPDLPSGGSILGLAGIREAYETGRGSFTMRAKATIGPISARKSGITITELPYMVGPEQVMEKIKDGVTAKRIVGISAANDFTDRKNGLKLVIEVKTGVNPEAVLEQLFKHTPLESNFGINNVVLVGNQPQTLGIIPLLRTYLDHRIDVITRRSKFRLGKANDRLHLVEGLLIAIIDIDEVISVIRTSDDSEQARTRLMSIFDLTKVQADHILELRLRRLTKFSQVELEAERDSLRATIAELTEILANPELLKNKVSSELAAAARSLDTPRRTVLLEATAAPKRSATSTPIDIADDPCHVIFGATGRIVRAEVVVSGAADAAAQLAGTTAPLAVGDSLPKVKRRSCDAIATVIETTARAELAAITSAGRAIKLGVVGLPHMPAASVQLSAGNLVEDYLGLDRKKETVVGLVPLTANVPLALATARGIVKRVVPDWPDKQDFDVITLKAGDRVVSAHQAEDGAELVFVTSDAKLLRYSASLVRPQGRSAGGMTGINLSESDQVIAFSVLAEPDSALVATVASSDGVLAGADPGTAKVSPLSEFPSKGRATGGVRAHRFLKGETALSVAWVGVGSPGGLDARGRAVDLPTKLSARDGSGSPVSGVIAAIGTID